MSFVTQEDVFAALEPVLEGVFKEFAKGQDVTPAPFQRIPFDEAMSKYGSDKPDLRNPLELGDVTEHFDGGGFGIFAKLIKEKGFRAIAVRLRLAAAPAPCVIAWMPGRKRKCRSLAWPTSSGKRAGHGACGKEFGA